MTRALVALGSNLGDRQSHLDFALDALDSTPGIRLIRASTRHVTSPVGGPPGQGAFLNAAALIRTTLDPHALLATLHQIEAEAGRAREIRWGERTLDLDLLLFGKARIDTTTLTVPHPRMALRRFVLAPAAEVAPRMVDPATARPLIRLLDDLDRRPSYVALVAPAGPYRDEVARLITEALDPERIGFDGLGILDRWPSTGPPAAFDRRFRAAADALASANHSTLGSGDRWAFTDFWFDQFLVLAMIRHGSNPCLLLPIVDAFRSIRPTLLRPTFVALASPTPTPDAPESRPSRAIRAYLETAHRDVPVLQVEGLPPSLAAAEILAACEATRAAIVDDRGPPV